jgi:transposase
MLQSDDAGVAQRWLVIYSEAAKAHAQKQVCKELAKRSDADVKALTKLGNTVFTCQADAERGFRFLKDLLFLASSLLLKRSQSIMALMMVMTFCLLVYATLQHCIRQRFDVTEQSFADQEGKPTQKPTARWVFQCFVGIHLLVIDSQEQLSLNLKNHHQQLLALLGPRYNALLSL